LGKLTNSITLMAGITLLFYFGGLLGGTPTGALLGMIWNTSSGSLNLQNLPTSNLLLTIGGVASLVLGLTSVFLGIFLNNDLYYMVAFVTLFLNFGWNFLSIIQQIASYSAMASVFVALLFGPLMIIYVIGVVEWWRGVEP